MSLNRTLTVFVFLFLSGCITDPDSYVERYAGRVLQEQYESVNAITHQTGTEIIGSAAVMQGEQQRELSPDDLFLHSKIEAGHIRIAFHAPVGQTSSTANRLIEGAEFGTAIHAAMKSVLLEISASMENVAARGVTISLIVVPEGSGYTVMVQSGQGVKPLPLLFLAVFYRSDEANKASGADWWARQLRTVSHELLHLEHILAKIDISSELQLMDAETAATLTGWCYEARFIQSLGIRGSWDSVEQISLPSEHKFPGIYRGEFSPDLTRFSTARYDATPNGQEMARAVLFNFVTHGDIYLDLGDPEQTAPLFDLCEGLPKHIPRYSSGEIKSLHR